MNFVSHIIFCKSIHQLLFSVLAIQWNTSALRYLDAADFIEHPYVCLLCLNSINQWIEDIRRVIAL